MTNKTFRNHRLTTFSFESSLLCSSFQTNMETVIPYEKTILQCYFFFKLLWFLLLAIRVEKSRSVFKIVFFFANLLKMIPHRFLVFCYSIHYSYISWGVGQMTTLNVWNTHLFGIGTLPSFSLTLNNLISA